MTTYKAQWGDDAVTMTADFAEASCPVIGDECGRQVADFSHSPNAAMRAILSHEATNEGLDAEDQETINEIDAAVEGMTETDD